MGRMAHQAVDGLAAVRPGWGVDDAAGEAVGEVLAVGAGGLRVQTGHFFPREFVIPAAAIARVADGRVALAVAKGDLATQGWEVAPAGETLPA